MRFAFVEEHRKHLPVDRLCRMLNITSRGFRAWRSRPISRRQRDDMTLLAHITGSRYMTYKQARELGANVIMGETGNRIVIARDFVPAAEKRQAKEEGRDARPAFFHKPHTVFNVSQIENLPESFGEVVRLAPQNLPLALETVKNNSGVAVRMGGNKAFYSPDLDFIQMPLLDAFPDALDFDRTFYHEMIHATGAKHRLERNIRNQKGSKDYAREELVAEMGAAFVCATLGIKSTLRLSIKITSSSSMIKTWRLTKKGSSILNAKTLATGSILHAYSQSIQTRSEPMMCWMYQSSNMCASTTLNSSPKIAIILIVAWQAMRASPRRGIENFWNQSKRHLRRYNGIPKEHFHLFLKECEWRFNYRPVANLRKVLERWWFK